MLGSYCLTRAHERDPSADSNAHSHCLIRSLIGLRPPPVLHKTSVETHEGVHSRCPRPGGIMGTYPFPLVVILALAFAFPSRAAEKPRPAQDNQAKKVWTNDDMGQLRARGLITTFSQAPETTAQAPVAVSERATFTAKTEDPTWYAQRAADLQAELDKREAA